MTFFVWVPLDFLQDIRLNQGNDNNWYFCGCQLSLEGLNEFSSQKVTLHNFVWLWALNCLCWEWILCGWTVRSLNDTSHRTMVFNAKCRKLLNNPRWWWSDMCHKENVNIDRKKNSFWEWEFKKYSWSSLGFKCWVCHRHFDATKPKHKTTLHLFENVNVVSFLGLICQT